MKCFVAAKIQGLRVTERNADYHGSQGIPRHLMKAAGISPYEQVHVANKTTGQRWITYAIPTDDGSVSLNGAASHMGMPGDSLIIMSYRHEEKFSGAVVIEIDADQKRYTQFPYFGDPPSKE